MSLQSDNISAMLDHHIQIEIVKKLISSDRLRFSELQPEGVENKLFSYHLKKVLADKLAMKDESGLYSLTDEGRRLGLRILEKVDDRSMAAEAVLFLVIRRASDGSWMFYRRKTQPLRGMAGFMHAIPAATESIIETAANSASAIGLKCTFSHRGSGYFRIKNNNSLESFTHFDVLVAEDAEGDLIDGDDMAEYFWVSDPATTDKLLPNMNLLLRLYETGQHFFHEAELSV